MSVQKIAEKIYKSEFAQIKTIFQHNVCCLSCAKKLKKIRFSQKFEWSVLRRTRSSTFSMPSFKVELAALPFEIIENICDAFGPNDTRFMDERRLSFSNGPTQFGNQFKT